MTTFIILWLIFGSMIYDIIDIDKVNGYMKKILLVIIGGPTVPALGIISGILFGIIITMNYIKDWFEK